MQETIVYLALGSNLGDRRANLVAALVQLREHVVAEAVSSLYETEPAYMLDQPRFLNAALRGRTTLSPTALLVFVKEIERALGRTDGPRYGPRLVDIDLLLYGDILLDSPDLIIPHPRMGERPFVLVPLAEIAPDLVPPGWSESVGMRAVVARDYGDVITVVGWDDR